MAIFEPSQRQNREAPPLPELSGIEYPRAAMWASGNLNNVLNDDKGSNRFSSISLRSNPGYMLINKSEAYFNLYRTNSMISYFFM